MFSNLAFKIIPPLIFAAVSILVPLIACNDTKPTGGGNEIQVSARLSSFTNCKLSPDIWNGMSCQATDEGLAYLYDGAGNLLLKHINAGFNCCGQPFTAEISVTDSTIVIREHENSGQFCRCLCLHDLYYEFNNLPEGQYRIEFNGLYLEGNETGLTTIIAAQGLSSGSYCLHRGHYPWTINDEPPGPAE